MPETSVSPPLAVPLTADADNILPTLPVETADDSRTCGWLWGWSMTGSISQVVPTPPDPDSEDDPPRFRDLAWPHAVQRFREGLDVHVWCRETLPATTHAPDAIVRRPRRVGGTKNVQHVLRLHPDGTITMLNHPDHTTPPGGRSEHLNPETELFLHALGGGVPACVRAALWLTSTQQHPDRTVPASTVGLPHTDYLLRLYAAVAWAQPSLTQPAWPKDAWTRLINAGITPRILSWWVTHGWAVHDALLFLNRRASFQVAEQWRQAGDVTARAAKLAGRGETPADEERWMAVGFRYGEADRWRDFPHWGSQNMTPAEAWKWHCDNVLPNSVASFRDLANGTEKNPDFKRPSLEQALEWTRAGIPSDEVISWFRQLHGQPDGCDIALQWAKVIPAFRYQPIADWNRAHPNTALTPSEVTRLGRIGVPLGEPMGIAAAAGLTNLEMLRPLDMTVSGKRWLGIEARRVLTDAARAFYRKTHQHDYADRPPRETGETDAHGNPKKRPVLVMEPVLDAMMANRWDKVVWYLRGNGNSHASALWTPYLEWVATRPTPPRWGKAAA